MSYPQMALLPLSLAKGLHKSPVFNSVVQKNAAGMSSASAAIMPYPCWAFEFDMDGVQGNEDIASSAIAAFMGTYIACQGRNNLFLFLDPQDNTVVTCQFGTGDGSTKNFQLSRSISGATDIIQNVVGSIQVYINGTLTSAYSLSATGVVQFTTAPAAAAVITWSGQFQFLCRFSEDTVDAVRSFTTNNGIDQWNVSSVKFQSEFVAPGTTGVVFTGGGSGGIFLPATPLAVLLNPTAAQTITGFPLSVTGIASETANVATAGFLSLANTDAIDWRNRANSGNLALNVNSSDQLVFNGTVLGSGGGAVSSVFTRTGAVVATSGDYTVSQITGAAPLASPTFTGTPAAPTPLTADNSTTLATTAFVKAQGYITSSAVTTVFGRAGAVVATSGDYTVSQVTGAAPLASPTFTGTPAAPTPLTADNSTTIATTAFVKAQSYLTSAPVSSVFTRTGAVVAAANDYSFSQISGTAVSSQLPTPTTGAIGGVKAVSAVSHQWVSSIDTTGTPQLTQPAFTDVSGVATIAQVPSRLLSFQKQTAVITPASNTETAIYSYTIPANTFQLGSGIRITCVFAHTTGSASTNYKCEFGGSGTVNLQSGATGGGLAQWNLLIMQDAVSANTQYISRLQSMNVAGVIVVPLAPVTATETTSGAITVQITAAATGGVDSYTGYVFIVEQLV